MKLNTFTATVAAALLASTAMAQDLKFPIGEGDFSWDSYTSFAEKTDLSGQQLTIFGPWLGAEQEAFNNVLSYFASATGVDARFTGSDSFEQQIIVDSEAGSAPNVAIFPQPGLARTMAARGFLEPLGKEAADWVKDNYVAGDSWVTLSTFEGPDKKEDFYGIFYKVSVKSLVWYVPENFEDAGYEVPQSLEELKALSDQIVEDGGTPWCIGLGSGGATGWPATDWVEDMMLRINSPAVYDQWVSNEIPFNDPYVVAAIEEFGSFVRNDDYVAGGSRNVAATDFRDSPKGLFGSPPQCYMHRQASFVPAFFPDGVEVGLDADFFYFPASTEKDLGSPVLGAGTLFGITNDSPAARALITFLETPIAHELWMAQGGFLTPHQMVNRDVFSDDLQAKLNDVLFNATTFRFDASDLMPGAVGAGTFWTGMVDYTGGKSALDVATEIQNSWDSIK